MAALVDMLASAIIIRDAKNLKSNTAQRVGQLLCDIVDTYASGLSYIDPATYRAVGDGAVSDNAAILDAITAGIAAGKPVHGYGRTYGITGNLFLPDHASLQDIKFKQLTPGAGGVRTLTSAGGSNIKLVRVTVDRNGDGTHGAHQVDAGIYIDGGSGHYFEDIDVFGDDIGSGFALWNATDSYMVRVHAHDIKYLLGADPLNDRVQGIHLANCTNVRMRDCHANDIGGNFGGGYTLRYSRGWCFSGCTDLRIWGCDVSDVDQGFDTTGGTGNTGFVFDHCDATNCLTYGFKFANTARNGQVNNCTTTRCALSGFIAAGPTGTGMTAVATSDIEFNNNVAYDTGYAGLPSGVPPVPVNGTKVGFRVTNGTFDLNTTIGMRFNNCKAHDRQAVPTMAFGFWNEVAANTNGRYNEAVDCISIGHTGAAFFGMNSARCEVSRITTQSIPDDGLWHSVDWTADVDLGEMHSISSNNDSVYARRAGKYSSQWGVVFQANNAGRRGIRLVRNGVVVAGTTVLLPVASGGETSCQATWTSVMDEGDSLRIEVFQDSGVPLNLMTTSGGVVEQVG